MPTLFSQNSLLFGKQSYYYLIVTIACTEYKCETNVKHITCVIPTHPNKSPLRLVVLSTHSTGEKVKAKSRGKELVPGHSWQGVEPDKSSARLKDVFCLHLEKSEHDHSRVLGLASGGGPSCPLGKLLTQNTECRCLQALKEPEFKPWPL